MGTNVHSAVAGISTSNALAKLKPPPPDAVLGSEDAPWLQLTAWELAKLRKRMKKNAVWSPSDTMIARELKTLGRGIEAYRAAKTMADAAGEPFPPTLPAPVDGESGNNVLAEGAISVDALGMEDIQLSNRGMKLNEAKKLKKENQAKELAKLAAEEAEESARKMAEAAKAMKGLFVKPQAGGENVPKTPAKTPSKRKRRESTVDTDTTKDTNKDTSKDVEGPKSVIKPPKRSKTETPVPVPQSLASNASAPVTTVTTAPIPEASSSAASTLTSVPSPVLVPVTTTAIPVPVSSPKKSSTPILPPSKETKKEVAKEVKKPAPIVTTRRQTSVAATPTPVPEPLPARRPASRGKAASVEPTTTSAKERPRRASTAHTAHNTPAPEPYPVRAPRQRAKRPAPGPVTEGVEGSTAVSVGKRTAAPRKKAGPKKQQKDEEKDVEKWDEVDDEGNIIDPNEPRYCTCNRVSFGVMICCENNDCEKEWFHLECVGLSEIPPRTTKWYCPDCRVKLGIGEKGEISARGRKK